MGIKISKCVSFRFGPRNKSLIRIVLGYLLNTYYSNPNWTQRRKDETRKKIYVA